MKGQLRKLKKKKTRQKGKQLGGMCLRECKQQPTQDILNTYYPNDEQPSLLHSLEKRKVI
jgi:hypothetical protein